MYALTVVFGPASIALLYRSEEKATEALSMLRSQENNFEIVDDFGQTIYVNRASLHGFILENWQESKMAQVEQMLHRGRVQIVANNMAASDPSFNQRPAGPAIISPMGNGHMPTLR